MKPSTSFHHPLFLFKHCLTLSHQVLLPLYLCWEQVGIHPRPMSTFASTDRKPGLWHSCIYLAASSWESSLRSETSSENEEAPKWSLQLPSSVTLSFFQGNLCYLVREGFNPSILPHDSEGAEGV